MGFRPEQRIRKAAEFQKCREKGRKVFGRHLICLFCPNDKTYARIGLIVTKKTGTAVTRNRWKRVIREYFRRESDRFAQGLDYVWIVKSSFQGKPPDFIRDEIEELLRKIKRP